MSFLLLWYVILMKMHLKNNRTVAKVGFLYLIVGVALAGTVWMTVMLREARQRLLLKEQQLAQLPETEARTAALESEVAKRQRDVDRIESFVVQKRDQLSEVVGEIEAAGAKRGLSVNVPAVEEKVKLDESGNEVPPEGPVQEVRLKITATGQARDLLAFLHEIEHMQRLTYFESWRLDGSEQTARNQAAALSKESAPARPGSLLLADLIVAVRREEEGKK